MKEKSSMDHRRTATSTAHEGAAPQRRWSNLMPLFVALVVISELTFLGRLDMAKNAAMMHSWTNSFNFPSFSSSSKTLYSADEEEIDVPSLDEKRVSDGNCKNWLEQEDAVPYSRDFRKDPILVSGLDEEWNSCSVGCKFGHDSASDKRPDAAFGLHQDPKTARVLRSMESSHYYPENNIGQARRRGYHVVMTTSLSSDVPVGYFSWAEYDLMAPMHPKSESAHAAAFISNCGARNFRLEALDMLEKLNIKIDSYGACHRNSDGRVDKLDTLKRYKFSLAFENSNEEDYVTEKFFQSLVAGAVPVVIGAPNIQDFAPSPVSVLHIRELSDVPSIAKTMKYLAENPNAYNQSVRSGDLTLKAMKSAVVVKFKSLNHIPIWKQERPESIRGGNELKVYRIYPVGLTQRQALHTFRFSSDDDFSRYVESNPCAKFEVMFV
ncbi:putative fucosyltransferase-like protein isoform X2 [Magnolia sinica]|uniref:putative fucosyltransferase-like protein isoform X2 n=1 Tax=Magnolia sinica TaxID=86752 RepID=UPI002659A555|nr:putative fucosyltransferase-like protein isoform X2 [Magnolia sinica]